MSAKRQHKNGKELRPPSGRNRYLPRRLRAPLIAIVDRFRNGEQVQQVGPLPRDITRSVTKLQRRLAVDFLRMEGVMKGEIARLFDIDRTTVYEDIKWLADIRRKEMEPSMVIDNWVKGIKAMGDTIERADRIMLENEDDAAVLAEWSRIKASTGRDLAAEMRQMGTSQAMLAMLKEGKGSMADGFPNPSDTVGFLDHIYRTRVLGIEDKRGKKEGDDEIKL